MWPGPGPTCTPSFILIHPTVWPQYPNVTDRQDRQRSDSAGRTILETVAQKLVPCRTDDRFLLSALQALVTLTLDRVIQHTIVHHSSSSIYISNFIEIRKTFLWPDYPHGLFQVQRHMTEKLGQIAKIQPDQIQILCCSLRISDHLPAANVNGGGDRRRLAATLRGSRSGVQSASLIMTSLMTS